ncbi:ATP-dependent DNA helicase MER3 [Elasticomyces elasticus]|nr:ATP-dependent DNA helicase MER3 [Elasticomyces elasticus]
MTKSGVAFHHAGLSGPDRAVVERGFLQGEINVICCTSTLAVGINLPCHMVIIKNTVTYTSNTASFNEYSDLEVMQMLGRAGRPQFDDSAVAVIMTRLHKVAHYEQMMSGQEVLESCLHKNLIEHLNAEIGLGTISDMYTAKKWLSGTFLYVRLRDNPDHYKLDGDAVGRNIEERLERICSNGLSSLIEYDLVSSAPKLKSTEFGDAMARYYINFETMKGFLGLPPKAKLSMLLSTLSQASEFKEIRLRGNEKPVYRDLNKSTSIKFPINVNLALPAHKVSLIIQSILGGIDLPTDEGKIKSQYTMEQGMIFQHAQRLIRCIIDCQLFLDDSVASRNALMLARSLGAKVWDDSPLLMRQIETIGNVAVRKLVNAGIKSIDELEHVPSHRLETILSRNPPYGMRLLEKVQAFPRLRVAVHLVGQPIVKKGDCVAIRVKAEIGFMNEKPPIQYNRKPVYVCLLAETSEGRKLHFCRISAKKLNNGQDVVFPAQLTHLAQKIVCHVMCDEIAGTLRYAELKHNIPASFFHVLKAQNVTEQIAKRPGTMANTSQQRAGAARLTAGAVVDEYGDNDIEDTDLAFMAASDQDISHIDDFDDEPVASMQRKITADEKQKPGEPVVSADGTLETWTPQQLPNGKWACNHKCKDKRKCKHLCCRDGIDNKPKPPRPKTNAKPSAEATQYSPCGPTQTKLSVSLVQKASPLKSFASSEYQADASKVCKKRNSSFATPPKSIEGRHKIHGGVRKVSNMSYLPNPPACTYGEGSDLMPSAVAAGGMSSDFAEGLADEDLLSLRAPLINKNDSSRGLYSCGDSDTFGDNDEEMLDASLFGLEDPQPLRDTEAWDPHTFNVDDAAQFDTVGYNIPGATKQQSSSMPERHSLLETIASQQRMPQATHAGSVLEKSLFLPYSSSISNEQPASAEQICNRKRTVGSIEESAEPSSYSVAKKPRTAPAFGAHDIVSEGRVEEHDIAPDDEVDERAKQRCCSNEENKAPILTSSHQSDPVPLDDAALNAWLLEEFGDIVTIAPEQT